jgi:hypothetical protein
MAKPDDTAARRFFATFLRHLAEQMIDPCAERDALLAKIDQTLASLPTHSMQPAHRASSDLVTDIWNAARDPAERDALRATFRRLTEPATPPPAAGAAGAGALLPDLVELVRARRAGTRPIDTERAPLLAKLTELLKRRIVEADEQNVQYYDLDVFEVWDVLGVQRPVADRLLPWKTVIVPHVTAQLKAASPYYVLMATAATCVRIEWSAAFEACQ